MWNSPQNITPDSELLKDHMKVLKEAVQQYDQYDIRTPAVYDALDFIAGRRPHLARQAIPNFKQALEWWEPQALHLALMRIKEGM